jgi:alpha-mannosidase
LHGRVRLLAPPEWTAEPIELPFMLPPGEHLETAVTMTAPKSAAPGLYPVRAELAVTGNAPIPASWRQVVEDVCVVRVGETTDQILRMLAEPQAVVVSAGEAATLSVTVGTDAYADLAAEAHLISPWGTWEWLGPCVVGAEIPARGSVVLDFAVTPPASVQPGEWWALIRIACSGHLLYTPAVKVTVR